MFSAANLQAAPVPLPAAIQRYFEVALYLLVFTGFGTLASTGGLDTATVVLVGAALLFRGFLLAQHRALLIPERWTAILTLCYVVFYLLDYFLISGSFLNATVHLVLFVMVVRMFSAQRDRDHYFLLVLSFLMVLAAAVLTVDSTFLLAFAGFMLTAVVTAILMEMKRAAAKASVLSTESNPLAYRSMAFSLAGASPVLVLFILLGAAAIFFILPRISGGYLGAYARGGELTTGFSDQVQLGNIGQIQRSNSVVMHIQIDGDEHGSYDLKWRGVALNQFDGRIWSSPHEQHMVARGLSGRFLLSQPGAGPQAPKPTTKPTIHYRVLMEPLGTNVFFLAPTPLHLEGNYGLVVTDNDGAVFDLDSQHPLSRYEAASNIGEPGAGQLRAAFGPYPPEVGSVYLSLPPLDPRIPQLAAQITASAHNQYDKALALEAYLRSQFGYTLQLPRIIPRDPLANFLFERKQGHCEYFATSMAVMLRTLGIPSRLVNGFRTGDFNDLTSQYVVRESNAHSWVEAYFPGYGWVGFDPTPAAPAQVQTGWGRVMLYMDAMASFWREWVINYDASHQQNVGQEATRSGRNLFHHLQNWAHRRYQASLAIVRRMQDTMSRSPLRWSLSGVLISVFLLLLANGRRLWQALRRRRLAAYPARSPRLAASIWYERMTRLLARRGWRKYPAQTPEEFVTSIDDAALRDWITQFTRHYEHARFGASAEDAQRLPELYEEIAGATRR